MHANKHCKHFFEVHAYHCANRFLGKSHERDNNYTEKLQLILLNSLIMTKIHHASL